MAEKVFLEVDDVKPVYLIDDYKHYYDCCRNKIIGVDVTLHGQTKRFDCGGLRRDDYAYKILDEEGHAETFFKEGVGTAFDLIRKVYELHFDERFAIFGTCFSDQIIAKYDYCEIKEKLDQWERIVIGDEIKNCSDKRLGIVINEKDDCFKVLTPNGNVITYCPKSHARKTGKHFDEIADYVKGGDNGNITK